MSAGNAKERVIRRLELERAFGVEAIPRADPAAQTDEPPAEAPPEGFEEFEKFRREVLKCVKCGLHKGRTQVVFGVGSLTSPVVFVGEGPGADEDAQGEPFVGRAGQLLTKLLKEIGVARERVYIANIVKCRPPDNRAPALEEIRACFPYLQRQLRFIHPQVLCALGGVAAATLLNTEKGITSLRGRYHEVGGRRIFPTFHPAYILRNMSQLPVLKRDLRTVCRDAGLT